MNQPISAQQTTDRVTTGKGPKELRRAQHHPSAQGQEGLPRKGGGRADQEASSSDKEQRVELNEKYKLLACVSIPRDTTHVVDFESNMGEHVRGSGSVASTVGVHRH